MIRLELTLNETHHLQQWLTDAPPRLPTQQEQREALQTVLTKLAAATDQATRQLHCPVCRHGFTQENAGRTGRYCSAACKQKAYRQRRLDARKQFGPPRKR